MIMGGSPVATPSEPNRNLFNGGSEWQNDFGNLPDYFETFYRNYDAAIGRFIAIDPVAEATESMTAYQYGNNNPILFNDPMGDLARLRYATGGSWVDIRTNDFSRLMRNPGAFNVFGAGGSNISEFMEALGSLDLDGGGMSGGGSTRFGKYSIPNDLLAAARAGNMDAINEIAARYGESIGVWESYVNLEWYKDSEGKPYTVNGNSGAGEIYFLKSVKGSFQYSQGRVLQAGIIGPNASFKDWLNYTMAGVGGLVTAIDIKLRLERNALVSKSTNAAIKYVNKTINPSLKSIGNFSRKLGLAGLGVQATQLVMKYIDGEAITRSDLIDFGVGIVLTSVTVANPFGAALLGIYGIADSAGVFDGIKSSLGGDVELFRR